MNTQNITLLANLIEALPPERFNMRFWATQVGNEAAMVTAADLIHDCGTCACIGGWAQALATPPGERVDVRLGLTGDPTNAAAKWLGIDDDQHLIEQLFMPDLDWASITQAQAVATLRRLAETGEVQWP
jgi:hypothetical protein